MITCDGDRSLKRKWFARKQLAAIKEMGVPGKATMLDGFLVKVHQLDGLEGGRITAPMGAIVACSTQSGIKMAVADYWAGGCTGYTDSYIPFNDTEGLRFGLDYTEWTTLAFKPVVSAAFHEPTMTLVAQYSGKPSLMPYKLAEALNVTITDNQFLDFNENGTPDYPYQVLDSATNLYNGNGKNTEGRRSVTVINGAGDIRKTCFNLPGQVQIAIADTILDWVYDDTTPRHISAIVIDEAVDPETQVQTPAYGFMYLADIVTTGMPSGLRNLMLTTFKSTVRQIGAYAFRATTGEQVFIQALWFDVDAISIDGSTLDQPNDWFNANPAERKWRVFLSVTVGNTATLINSDQFMPLLLARTTRTLIPSVVDWRAVGKMLHYLFVWPSPANLRDVYAWNPHDSVMFHDENNEVQIWTRRLSGVKINATGMHDSTIIVPVEVTDNPGTRPEISYASNGLYFCACNDVAKEIRATYYGSPFTEWIKLPDMPDLCTLMQVRPVQVTTDKIVLIGVVKYTPIEPTAEDEIRYHFTSLLWTSAKELEGLNSWNIMMRLPFPVSEPLADGSGADCFETALYGNDAMVKAMQDYPSPPPALPQTIRVNYDGYNYFP